MKIVVYLFSRKCTRLHCVDLVEFQPSSSSGAYSIGTLSRVPLPSDKAVHSSQQNQHPVNLPTYATPSSLPSHTRNTEQTKSMTTASSVGHSGSRTAGIQGYQSQPTFEQNGQNFANESR